MDAIEQIGSYAGLAAIVGLAVLAALYFSQARDVKRLREWAGRAPERVMPRPPVVARPVPRPPGQATMPPRPPAPPVPRPPGAAPGVGGATPAGGRPPPPGTPPSGAPAPPGAPPPGVGIPRPAPAPAPAVAPATPAAQPAPAASAAGAAPAQATGPATDDQRDEGPRTEASPAVESGSSDAAPASAPAPATPAAAAGTALPPREESPNGTEEHPAVAQDTGVHDAQDTDEEDFEHDEPEDEEFDDHELEHEPEDDDFEREDGAGFHEPDVPEHHWVDSGTYEPTRAVPGRPTIPIGVGREPEPPLLDDGPPILPPYSQSRPGAVSDSGSFATPGRILAVIAATVAAAVVVALAVVQLGGDDGESGQPASESAEPASKPRENPNAGPAVDPSKVTVAVLNGTTVPGLAAQLGDSIKRRGFQLGNVTNFIDQQRAESVVLYAPNAEREAAAVGRRLKIAQRAPVDADSQEIAGDATVIVIVGADQTP